jgi:hypothetical protein
MNTDIETVNTSRTRGSVERLLRHFLPMLLNGQQPGILHRMAQMYLNSIAHLQEMKKIKISEKKGKERN